MESLLQLFFMIILVIVCIVGVRFAVRITSGIIGVILKLLGLK